MVATTPRSSVLLPVRAGVSKFTWSAWKSRITARIVVPHPESVVGGGSTVSSVMGSPTLYPPMVAGVKPSGKPVGPVGMPPAPPPPVPGGTVITLVPPEPADVVPPLPLEVVPPLAVAPEPCAPPDPMPLEAASLLPHPTDSAAPTMLEIASQSPNWRERKHMGTELRHSQLPKVRSRWLAARSK